MSLLDSLSRGWYSGWAEFPELAAGSFGLLEGLIPGEQESLTGYSEDWNRIAEDVRGKGAKGQSVGLLEKITEGLGAAPGTLASMAPFFGGAALALPAAPILAPAVGFGAHSLIRSGDEGLAVAAGQGLKGAAEGAAFGLVGGLAGKYASKEAKALMGKQLKIANMEERAAMQPAINAARDSLGQNLTRRALHGAGTAGIVGSLGVLHQQPGEDTAASAVTMGVLGLLGGVTPKQIAGAGKYRDPFITVRKKLDELEAPIEEAGRARVEKLTKEAEARLNQKVDIEDLQYNIGERIGDREPNTFADPTMEISFARFRTKKGPPGVSIEDVTPKDATKFSGDANKVFVLTHRDADGIPRGALSFAVEFDGKTPVDLKMAVDENFRRQGIGTSLYNKAKERFPAIEKVMLGETGEAFSPRGAAFAEAVTRGKSGVKEYISGLSSGPNDKIPTGTVPASDFAAAGLRAKPVEETTKSFQAKVAEGPAALNKLIVENYAENGKYVPRSDADTAMRAARGHLVDENGKFIGKAEDADAYAWFLDDLRVKNSERSLELDSLIKDAAAKGDDIGVNTYTQMKDAHLLKSLNDHLQLQGIRSMGGNLVRTLGRIKQNTPEWLELSAKAKAKFGADADRIIKMAEMSQDNPELMMKLAKAIDTPTMWDVFQEYWINSLLSGFPTHFVNFNSNTLRASIDVVEKGFALRSEYKKGIISRDDAIGEFKADIGSIMQAFRLGVKALGMSAKDENFDPATIADRFKVHSRSSKIDERTKAIEGKTGEFIRYPGRMLQSMDILFKIVNGERAAASKAYRMVSEEIRNGLDPAMRVEREAELRGLRDAEVHPDILKEIKQQGKLQTFTEDLPSYLGPIGKARQIKVLGVKPGIAVLPFYSTPFNVIKQALSRSPLGYLRFKALKNSYDTGKITSKEYYQERAATHLGTAITVGLVGLAKAGFLTGSGPENQQDRQNLLATGWRPYSIHIPGVGYLQAQRIEPLGTVLGMAADIAEFGDSEDKLGKLLATVKNNATDKSFLYGLESLAAAWANPQQRGETYYKQMSGSLIPTLFSKASQAVDPYMRQVDARSATLGIPDAMAYRIPGLSSSLPQKSTSLGEPSERWGVYGTDSSAKKLLSGVQSMFSAVPVSSERPNVEVEKEFDRLSGYEGMPPAMPNRSKHMVLRGVHGENVKLTNEEYAVYDKYNAMAKEALARVIVSPQWNTIPDPNKAKLMSSIYNKFRRAANNEINASIRRRTTVGD